jgi:phosphoribosylaminoimidazole (AIR) synthetase
MSPGSAYSTFNMGCGFAVYCRAGAGSDVVRLASRCGLRGHIAGVVEEGPRRVVLSELDVVYESEDLDFGPRG